MPSDHRQDRGIAWTVEFTGDLCGEERISMKSTSHQRCKCTYPLSSRLAVCAVLLILFGAVGCRKSGDEYLDRHAWKERDVNVFINGRKINYYRSTFADVQRAFDRTRGFYSNSQ